MKYHRILVKIITHFSPQSFTSVFYAPYKICHSISTLWYPDQTHFPPTATLSPFSLCCG